MRSVKRDLARFRFATRLIDYIEQGGQKKRVVYRCKDIIDKVFCASCANKMEAAAITTKTSTSFLPRLEGGGIYQQGPPLSCGSCKKELHSVRGEQWKSPKQSSSSPAVEN